LFGVLFVGNDSCRQTNPNISILFELYVGKLLIFVCVLELCADIILKCFGIVSSFGISFRFFLIHLLLMLLFLKNGIE
jgi:hypothetical protein